eukprot:CAMPEP_0113883708 /NCGR_PEP_ID=MMETSP0780_2-20120614/9773_1 /TAXON_ID=652834 /ORGANISM="Palpitomonas bilix" /LENGTH=1137 /DNA_ID=CAMNT_0000871089 /DNA_START=112 /DNA_END=3525 /DNA_ORIENTATION=+ /assembly_acc=CAM_ASM_000599
MAPKKDPKKGDKAEVVDPDAVGADDPFVSCPISVKKVSGLRSLLPRPSTPGEGEEAEEKYSKIFVQIRMGTQEALSQAIEEGIDASASVSQEGEGEAHAGEEGAESKPREKDVWFPNFSHEIKFADDVRLHNRVANAAVSITVFDATDVAELDEEKKLGSFDVSFAELLTEKADLNGSYELKKTDGTLSSALADIEASFTQPIVNEEDQKKGNLVTLSASITSLPEEMLPKEKETEENHNFVYDLSLHFTKSSTEGAPPAVAPNWTMGQIPLTGEESISFLSGRMEPVSQGDEASEGEASYIISFGTKKFFLPAALGECLKSEVEARHDITVLLARRPKSHPADATAAAAADADRDKYRAEAIIPSMSLLSPGSTHLSAQAECSRTALPAANIAGLEDAPSMPTEAEAPPSLFAVGHSVINLDLACVRPVIPRASSLFPDKKAVPKPSEVIPPRGSIKPPAVVRAAEDELRREVEGIVDSLATEYVAVMKETIGAGGDPNSAPAALRSDIVFHLNRSGRYHAFKETLKRSVVRVVREKFARSGEEDEDNVGEFYNELFVFLSQEVNRALNRKFREDVAAAAEPQADSAPVSDVVAHALGPLELAAEAEINGDIELASSYYAEMLAIDPATGNKRGFGGGESLSPKNELRLWLDYSLFCLRTFDISRAEECLSEAVAIATALDPGHDEEVEENEEDFSGDIKAEGNAEEVVSAQPGHYTGLSLLLYGCLMCIKEDFPSAEIFLNGGVKSLVRARRSGNASIGATILPTQLFPGIEAPSEVAARALLSVFYYLDEREEERSDALSRATILRSKALEAAGRREEKFDTPALLAAEFAASCSAAHVAETAISLDQQLQGWNELKRLLLFAKVYSTRHDYERAIDNLKQALEKDPFCEDALIAMGNAYFKLGQEVEAENAFKQALELPKPSQAPEVYVKLGHILLSQGEPASMEKAEEIYVKLCTIKPTATSWLGVGRCLLEKGDRAEAEEALAEANILNNRNPLVWGYLALLCLQDNRLDEADACIKEGLRLGLSDDVVLRRLGEVYMDLGRHAVAEQTLKKALAFGEDISTRVALGRALLEQNKLSEAEQNFASVVEAPDTEGSSAELKQASIDSLIAIAEAERNTAKLEAYKRLAGAST